MISPSNAGPNSTVPHDTPLVLGYSGMVIAFDFARHDQTSLRLGPRYGQCFSASDAERSAGNISAWLACKEFPMPSPPSSTPQQSESIALCGGGDTSHFREGGTVDPPHSPTGELHSRVLHIGRHSPTGSFHPLLVFRAPISTHPRYRRGEVVGRVCLKCWLGADLLQ